MHPFCQVRNRTGENLVLAFRRDRLLAHCCSLNDNDDLPLDFRDVLQVRLRWIG
jgi:hypothetical protein